MQSLYPGTQVTIGPAVEHGFYYDFARNEPFTPEDFPAIEQRMREIIQAGAPFIREVWPRQEALDFFVARGERFKAELIEGLPEGEPISIYRQGEWLDLCRGPHMRNVADVGDAFKLMKVAGAYWRGDHRNPMLTRIYGTAWRDAAELESHLHQLEEAERRDHRRIGREMDLFHIQEEATGSIFWHAKGWRLYSVLQDYMRRAQDARLFAGSHAYDKQLAHKADNRRTNDRHNAADIVRRLRVDTARAAAKRRRRELKVCALAVCLICVQQPSPI